jgi:hypothetical protein
MQTINTTTGQLQIDFEDNQQLKKFTKWLKKDGFDLFLKSKFNNDDNPITCISTDEKMEWGHYYELQ